MKILAAVLLGLAAQEIDHTKDSLDAVKAALAKKDAVLVDVREKGEWDQGHLQGALFLPLSWLKAEAKGEKLAEHAAEKLPAGKVLYLHCRSGGRVIPAAEILKKAGYDVRPLRQGFDDLKDAGFPVADPQ
ncbi:MAG: rhodanese-like domain-containing protein [Planctomycetaceae bacterium]|nr:rhodanese-like domain-containing protein [Planctomycetaceae bacterium]